MGDRSASVNEAACQATKPLPRSSDATVDMDQILCHRKQQQLYCFSKDATHNAWTISQLPIIHMLNYY